MNYIWKTRLFLSLLAGAYLLAAGGCGRSFKPGQGEFWWDDQQKQRLQGYRLPEAPGAPEGERIPASQPQKKSQAPRNPARESTATVMPQGQ